MADETKQRIEDKVARASRFSEGHGKFFRMLWVIAGVTVVVAGLAMTVFPGPAVVVIPLGLAMLAAEFTWARRLLSTGINRGVDAQRWMAGFGTGTKALAAAALICLVAAVVALVVLR